jgi:hypothetical protein
MAENEIGHSWTKLISDRPEEAIDVLYPELYEIMVHDRQIVALHNVIPKIDNDSAKGARYPDLIITFTIQIDGEFHQSIVIIEQQEAKAKDMAWRMFETFFRTIDRYKHGFGGLTIKPELIFSLLVYTNVSADKAMIFKMEQLLARKLEFWYKVFDVTDADVTALKQDKRPFALVILIAKWRLLAKKNDEKRVQYLRETIDLLETRELNDDLSGSIFRFALSQLQFHKLSQKHQAEAFMKIRENQYLVEELSNLINHKKIDRKSVV